MWYEEDFNGHDIFRFIEPNLGNIKRFNETYGDEMVLKNIEKYEQLGAEIISALKWVDEKSKDKEEKSMKDMNDRCKKALLYLDNILKWGN